VTTFTELFAPPASIRRHWFRSTTVNAATISSLAVPQGAKCAIFSAVGAGGWKNGSAIPGGGAAFARTKLINLTAGETFTIQVGSTKFSIDAGTSAGDSIITRDTGAVVVCKAARGTGTLVGGLGQAGLVADCVGDIKRAGSQGVNTFSQIQGGASGGDDGDLYCLGFGGRGARMGRYPAAAHGGGGIYTVLYDAFSSKPFQPGAGLICVEFFTKDPGLI
jgi:hypothetical protein